MFLKQHEEELNEIEQARNMNKKICWKYRSEDTK